MASIVRLRVTSSPDRLACAAIQGSRATALPRAALTRARVRGAAGIYIEYQHAMTREEVREEKLARYEAARDELRALLSRDGDAVSAETIAAIRRLLA